MGIECGDEHFYCPEGSGKPRNVTKGYYTLPQINGSNATRYAQAICEKSTYCAKGVRRLCPAGTYGDEEGLVGSFTNPHWQTSSALRKKGTTVHYPRGGYNRDGMAWDFTNELWITSMCSGWCPPGHECPVGTIKPRFCGDGYYAVGSAPECSKCPTKPAYLIDKTQTSQNKQQCYDKRMCCQL